MVARLGNLYYRYIIILTTRTASNLFLISYNGRDTNYTSSYPLPWRWRSERNRITENFEGDHGRT